MKKTVFIAINRAYITRNLLFNEFFRLLNDKYHVVILTPLYQDPDFNAKFGHIDIEPLFTRPLTPFKKKIERWFISIHRSLIFNSSSEVFAGLGRGTSVGGKLLDNGELVKYKKVRYFFAKYVFGKLLARKSVRSLFKFLDRIVLPCSMYDELINKYKPSLVFIPSLGADDEVALLRNCKKQNIRSVGMAGSWDNLSKWGLREKVDVLAVWSEYMKNEALLFQDYKENEIAIIGIPQFDYYVKPNIYTKDEFIKKFQLNPEKKTIFFGSEGPICTDDPYIVAFLQKKIKDGILFKYQILVRPHFGYGKRDTERYISLVDNETVYMDNFFEVSNFKDSTSLSLNTVTNLIAEINYCDVAITSTSTLVLDILANGKMPILYNFDEVKDKPFKESIKRLYGTLWFQEILKFDLDNMANNEEELVEKVKELTANSDKDLGKREKLIERLCFKVDGNSGYRLFELIDRFVSSHNNLFL